MREKEDTMDRSKQLGESSIPALLLNFSIPAITGMLVNALYNVVDRIFVGRGVGSQGIAGITVGFPLMIIIMAFGMLIGLGATSLISIRLGEQKKEEAELIMGNALTLLVAVSLVISACGLIFLDPLLILFGASKAIMPYARQYLSIILWGAVFQGIGFGMNNFIRAEGNPRIAMFTMLIGAILNTILDPVFIFVFNMGIGGAALATILSQMVSAVWVLYYFLGGASLLKFHLKNLKLRTPVVNKIFAIGSAPFAMQLAASLLNIILNNSLRIYGGDIAISAMGIINSISMLILMPIFGINQGAQPIIGYNYGARKFDRVKKTLGLAIAAATCVVIIGFIVTQLFPSSLIRMFNNKDKELISLGARGLRIFLLLLPVIGFQIVSANYFQAVGKPRHAMFLSLSRQVILLIPSLLILPRFFGLDGIFMAGPVSDAGSSILTGIWILSEIRHLERQNSENLALMPETEK
jgi:putative MATE family efflux protein